MHMDNDESHRHSEGSHADAYDLQNYASLKNSKKIANELKQKKLSKCDEFLTNLYGYSLKMWDGLGFFGTDHKKLGRLQGETVNFCTYFKSPRSLVMTILGVSIGTFLVVTEGAKLNLPKAQTISLIEAMEYDYHFSDAIALRSGNWFYVDGVFDHIREHQVKNRDEEDESKKFRDHRDIPEKWEHMTWHDKRFIEEYLCNRTKMYY